MSYADGLSGPLLVPVVEHSEPDELADSIRRFEEHCQHQGMQYRVHRDQFDFALSELRTETRFADLLVIGSECFYENLRGTPNPYLLDTLYHAECPVILVPETYSFPDSLVFTYDGSASSVYAIKQFTYLFPEWKTKQVTLVFAGELSGGEDIPHQTEMEEWVGRHYDAVTILRLGIDPQKYFTTWIENEKGILLVAGAMGRSGFSRMFRKSFVTELLHDQLTHPFFNETLIGNRLPLFLAHQPA